MVLLRHYVLILPILLCVGCQKAPNPDQPAAAIFKPYRFDDEFQSSATGSTTTIASISTSRSQAAGHKLFMLTDGLFDLVAIHSNQLVPRKADFQQVAGRQFIGKHNEYRNTLYLHPLATQLGSAGPQRRPVAFGIGWRRAR